MHSCDNSVAIFSITFFGCKIFKYLLVKFEVLLVVEVSLVLLDDVVELLSAGEHIGDTMVLDGHGEAFSLLGFDFTVELLDELGFGALDIFVFFVLLEVRSDLHLEYIVNILLLFHCSLVVYRFASPRECYAYLHNDQVLGIFFHHSLDFVFRGHSEGSAGFRGSGTSEFLFFLGIATRFSLEDLVLAVGLGDLDSGGDDVDILLFGEETFTVEFNFGSENGVTGVVAEVVAFTFVGELEAMEKNVAR